MAGLAGLLVFSLGTEALADGDLLGSLFAVLHLVMNQGVYLFFSLGHNKVVVLLARRYVRG